MNIWRKKNIKNLKIFDKKLAIIEHSKSSHNFSKTITKDEQVSQLSSVDSSLYSETEKSEFFLNEKNVKINKQSPYSGYASTYSVETLNSLNSVLKLKEAKSAIKTKLIDLLSEFERL